MEGAAALEEQLGAAPPPGVVAALGPAELEHLAGAVRAARREQRRALARAGDEALRHVPRLVRPAVRKVVGL